MALVLRTNGAPLSGALFVSNPRKRMNRRNGLALTANRARRNGLALTANRRNGLALTANRARRNTEYLLNLHGNGAHRRNTEYLLNLHGNGARRRMNRRNTGYLLNLHGNGARHRMNRRNTGYLLNLHGNRSVVRRNPMAAFANTLTSPVSDLVAKVPFVGKAASGYVAPVLMGVVVGAVHYGALAALQRIPYVNKAVEHLNPVKFTVGGVAVAVGLRYLPVGSQELRNQIACAALVAGGALDMYRFLSRRVGDLGILEDDDLDGLALTEMAGLGMDSSLGDGLAYDVVPLDGVAVEYSGASLADAAATPADLSVEEGEAAVRGAGAWQDRFGTPPIARQGTAGGPSVLAGRPGHRFGWLIHLIGFDRFQKLAALPPEPRVALIAQMKAQAQALADAQFASRQAGTLSGLALDMNGLAMDSEFGSIMHAGSAF